MNGGACIAQDTCSCPVGFYGALCEHTLPRGFDVFMCAGQAPDDPGVCSGRGYCIAENVCECYEGYSGTYCDQIYDCGALDALADDVCSGHGDCEFDSFIQGGMCSCVAGFTGTYCETCNREDCDEDGYTGADGDCNDNNAYVYPGAADDNCDDLDNDCDGEVDEGYVQTPTSCGKGACSAEGQLTCVDGTVQDICSPGSPSSEICDDLDNDCDGEVDEGGVCSIVSIGLPLELQFGLSGAALMVVFFMVYSYGRRRVVTR